MNDKRKERNGNFGTSHEQHCSRIRTFHSGTRHSSADGSHRRRCPGTVANRPGTRRTRGHGRRLRRRKPSHRSQPTPAGQHGVNENDGNIHNIHDPPHFALHTGATHTRAPPGHEQDGHHSGNALDDPNSLDTCESSTYPSDHGRHGFDRTRPGTSSDGTEPPQAHHQEEQRRPSSGHDRTQSRQRGSTTHRRSPAMRTSRLPGQATWPLMIITNTAWRNPIRQINPTPPARRLLKVFLPLSRGHCRSFAFVNQPTNW